MFSQYKKELIQLAPIGIPAVLSQLAQMATGFIDTVMAGHYSPDALAAIAIGTSLLHPVLVFFLGLFLAFNPLVAHLYGEDNNKGIRQHFHAAIFLAIVLSPVAVIALLNFGFILTLLNIEVQVAQLAIDYLNASIWGMPFLLLFFALRFCNEGLFSTLAVMAITLLAIPLNGILNYWFIYGGYGLDAMGAVGVGYATAITWFVMFVGMSIYTLSAKKYRALKLFKDFDLPNWTGFKSIFALGFPVAITLGFEITMFAAVSLMIARYPVEVMGGHQIAMNIASLTFMIPLGLSQAITARVSYFKGKGDPQAVRIAGFTGIGTCVLIMSLSASMMMLIPNFLVAIYTTDLKLTDVATGLLFFAALFQFSDGLQVSSSGALRGLKDTKMPMIITAISYWLVGFPIGYYLAEYQGYQVNGYWIGMIFGLSTAAVLLLSRWVIFSKQQATMAN